MKKHPLIWSFILVLIGLSLQSCDKLGIDIPKDRTATGKWEYGAGERYPTSLRNFKYTFTVKDKSKLDITLESKDTDCALWLYNPLGQLVANRGNGRVLSMTIEGVGEGQYTVIAGTMQRGVSGNFSMTVKGANSDLNQIKSDTKALNDEWKTGGGGENFSYSPRNHWYTLDVTEDNSTIDLVQKSVNSDGSMWLFNSLGQQIFVVGRGRELGIIANINKGRYTVIAGTSGRGVRNATYNLSVNGQFTNLEKVVFQEANATGRIANGAGTYFASDSPRNEYHTFEVTDDNTSVDIIMESGDFDAIMWLFNPLGQVVASSNRGRSVGIVQGVSKGKYIISCGTDLQGSSGAYTLSVVGKFQNFAKRP